jgi:hypothetical protein
MPVMPNRPARLTEHHVVALCAGLALLVPLHLALAATTLTGLALAVVASLVVAAVVGVGLRPDQRYGGVVTGLAAAVPFWPIALVLAWILGPDADLTGLTLMAGLPAAALTAVVLGEVLRDDEVSGGLGTVLGIGLVVLGLSVLVPGTSVRHEREQATASAEVGAELASSGLQPWLPEFDGYDRADQPRSREYYLGSYHLTFESGEREINVSVDQWDPEQGCSQDADCTEHEGYTVVDDDGSVVVRVVRGSNELSASVDGAGPSPEDLARALQEAPLASWAEVVRLDLDEDE